jgi:hypothetical protein
VETAGNRVYERQEMDPLGQETGTADPFLIESNPNYSDVHGDTPMFVDGGDPFHLSDGCGDIDGMPASCEEISERMSNGSAIPKSLEAFQGRPGFTFQSLGLGLYRYYVPSDAEALKDQTPGDYGNDDNEVVRINSDIRPGRWGFIAIRYSPQAPDSRTAQELERKLREAVQDAYKALSEREACRNLFGDKVDPRDLLIDLYTGQHNAGLISFGDLGSTGTAAQTEMRTMNSIPLQGKEGTYRRSIRAGANITINSNENGSYRAGYARRELGANVSDRVRRAITLLHELGHAASDLYGEAGSQIVPDDVSVKDRARISRENSQRVYDNCFR